MQRVQRALVEDELERIKEITYAPRFRMLFSEHGDSRTDAIRTDAIRTDDIDELSGANAPSDGEPRIPAFSKNEYGT